MDLSDDAYMKEVLDPAFRPIINEVVKTMPLDMTKFLRRYVRGKNYVVLDYKTEYQTKVIVPVFDSLVKCCLSERPLNPLQWLKKELDKNDDIMPWKTGIDTSSQLSVLTRRDHTSVTRTTILDCAIDTRRFSVATMIPSDNCTPRTVNSEHMSRREPKQLRPAHLSNIPEDFEYLPPSTPKNERYSLPLDEKRSSAGKGLRSDENEVVTSFSFRPSKSSQMDELDALRDSGEYLKDFSHRESFIQEAQARLTVQQRPTVVAHVRPTVVSEPDAYPIVNCETYPENVIEKFPRSGDAQIHPISATELSAQSSNASSWQRNISTTGSYPMGSSGNELPSSPNSTVSPVTSPPLPTHLRTSGVSSERFRLGRQDSQANFQSDQPQGIHMAEALHRQSPCVLNRERKKSSLVSETRPQARESLPRPHPTSATHPAPDTRPGAEISSPDVRNPPLQPGDGMGVNCAPPDLVRTAVAQACERVVRDPQVAIRRSAASAYRRAQRRASQRSVAEGSTSLRNVVRQSAASQRRSSSSVSDTSASSSCEESDSTTDSSSNASGSSNTGLVPQRHPAPSLLIPASSIGASLGRSQDRLTAAASGAARDAGTPPPAGSYCRKGDFWDGAASPGDIQSGTIPHAGAEDIRRKDPTWVREQAARSAYEARLGEYAERTPRAAAAGHTNLQDETRLSGGLGPGGRLPASTLESKVALHQPSCGRLDRRARGEPTERHPTELSPPGAANPALRTVSPRVGETWGPANRISQPLQPSSVLRDAPANPTTRPLSAMARVRSGAANLVSQLVSTKAGVRGGAANPPSQTLAPLAGARSEIANRSPRPVSPQAGTRGNRPDSTRRPVSPRPGANGELANSTARPVVPRAGLRGAVTDPSRTASPIAGARGQPANTPCQSPPRAGARSGLTNQTARPVSPMPELRGKLSSDRALRLGSPIAGGSDPALHVARPVAKNAGALHGPTHSSFRAISPRAGLRSDLANLAPQHVSPNLHVPQASGSTGSSSYRGSEFNDSSGASREETRSVDLHANRARIGPQHETRAGIGLHENRAEISQYLDDDMVPLDDFLELQYKF